MFIVKATSPYTRGERERRRERERERERASIYIYTHPESNFESLFLFAQFVSKVRP